MITKIFTNDLPINNAITGFLFCAVCMEEFRDGIGEPEDTPATYSRLDVGLTRHGIQVWCRRHNCNVIHIDFEGHKHPARTERTA